MNLSKSTIAVLALLLGTSALADPPPRDPVREVRNQATQASQWMHRGDKSLRKDDIRKACAAYQKAHAVLPSWWMPRLAIVRCGRITGVPLDVLLEHAATARAARPQLALAHLEYAAVMEEMGRKEEAARSYEAALRIDATRHDARLRLGVLLASLGNPKAAQRHLEQVLRHGFTEIRVLLSLAQVYEALNRLDDAESMLTSTLKKSRYPAQALARLIRFYDRHDLQEKGSAARTLFQNRFGKTK